MRKFCGPSIFWAFCQMLAARYPQANFDVGFAHRKAIMLDSNMIVMAHGHRKFKDLDRIAAQEFSEMWGKATNRELLSGHLHTEEVKDSFGITMRRAPTANNTDAWADREGFVGSRKRFQLIEYSETETKHIYYV